MPILQSGCEKGVVNYFLRVPLAVLGQNDSMAAAVWSNGLWNIY